MFVLRRTALRAALAASKPTPSVIVPKTRTFVSLNQSKLRSARQWTVTPLQRRWASDDAAATDKPTEEQLKQRAETEQIAEETVAEEAAIKAASENPAAQVNEVVEEVGAPEAQEAMESSTSSANNAIAADAASALAGAATAATGAAAATTPSPQSTPAQAAGQPNVNKTLYVGNIFFEVNEQALEDYFARFGNIKSTKIIYDARGLSKGFGYVEFDSIEDATRAVESSNQQVFQGRRLAVQFHRPRQNTNRRSPGGANPPSKTLFIGNMSFEMSDKDLSDLFREVRNVIDVRIAIDRRTGQPRGFAHADFIDVNSAMKAMDFLKGKELYGRQLRVDYSLSTPRTPGSPPQVR